MPFDPVADCGCGPFSSPLICGPFAAPVNPDKGRCHSNFTKTDCEAPVANAADAPAAIAYDANGDPIYTQDVNYQWQTVNNLTAQFEDIPGETGPSITLAAALPFPRDNGIFKCRIELNLGCQVTVQPVNVTGYPATFTVGAAFLVGGPTSAVSNQAQVI